MLFLCITKNLVDSMIIFQRFNFKDSIILRIFTGKKHPKIKLQRLRKIRILTFGSLVRQSNSFQQVLKLEQSFQQQKKYLSAKIHSMC